MNPTPSAITAIEGYVVAMTTPAVGWANTNAQIVTAMNTASIANPIPQGTISTPYTLAQFIAALSAGSLTNLKSLSWLYQLAQDIGLNNTPSVLIDLQLLKATSVITAGEATTLTTAVNSTELDPSWPSLVGWAQANIGRPIDVQDIATVRVVQ